MKQFLKGAGALGFCVWIGGAAVAGFYYNFDQKRQCIHDEGWLKGWFWCSSESRHSFAANMLRGLLWPMGIARSPSSISSDQDAAPLSSGMTQEQFNKSRVATLYSCWGLATRTDRDADSVALSKILLSLRRADPDMEAKHTDFLHFAGLHVAELEQSDRIESYYRLACAEPVQRLKAVADQGMLPLAAVPTHHTPTQLAPEVESDLLEARTDALALKFGGGVFAANCAACHQTNGAGLPPNFPSLIGSTVVKGPADTQIAQVLKGKNLMPPFPQLSDADIAAVVTYTRNSWGNSGGVVQAAQVAAQRGKFPSWVDLIEDGAANDLPPAQDVAPPGLASARKLLVPEILKVAAPRAPVSADKSPRDLFTIVATAAADDGTRKDVPVKGGWGYTIDDAIIIDMDDPMVPKDAPFNGVGLEYELAKYRSVIEVAASGHFNADEMDDQFSIEHERLKQRTFSQDGKQYDVLTFEVTARGREKAIQYTADYYFDITSFYGTGQPIFGRRFERGSAASLPATPTVGTNSPGTRESGGSAWRINCGKAKTVAERAICSDEALIAFDGYLSEAYASARSVVSATVFDEVRDSQRQWIQDRDTKCGGDVPCLMRATHSRTAALNAFAQRYRDKRAEAHAPAPVSREAEAGPSLSGRLTPAEIYRLASQSIVVVLAFDKSRDAISQGSGVVIAANTVATNCHVLKGSVESVVLYAGKAYQTKSIEGSDAFDYCIIRTEGLPASVVAVAPISSVSPGQRVYSVGNPQGLDLTIAEGLVSGLRPQNDLPLPLIQTSAAISHGSSGGGLFDEQGRVIGITVGTLKDSQNLNFALPVALSSYVIGQRFGDP